MTNITNIDNYNALNRRRMRETGQTPLCVPLTGSELRFIISAIELASIAAREGGRPYTPKGREAESELISRLDKWLMAAQDMYAFANHHATTEPFEGRLED